ncbi:uncharacterized protein LOC118480336 [Helianthus annuus]|uniref:uncharacterized protein LOC118480336 n=1 Tax=Helianthus annuus TaxID=4232 RepID=UPI001652F029|nr:uncharacterized protein LOC118480336 [Helianthus annuus]
MDNNRRNYQRRDQNRGNRSSHRGQGYSPQQPHQSQPPYVPNWAPQQAYMPYWAPPPCPFPTQTWAPQQWAPRPTSGSNNNYSAGPSNSQAHAHLVGVDPLEPTSLANAVQAMSLESGSRNNEQWHFDTGLQGWHDPQSSQQHQ